MKCYGWLGNKKKKSKRGKQKLENNNKTHKDVKHTQTYTHLTKKKKKATWQNTGGSDLTEDDELKHVSQ